MGWGHFCIASLFIYILKNAELFKTNKCRKPWKNRADKVQRGHGFSIFTYNPPVFSICDPKSHFSKQYLCEKTAVIVPRRPSTYSSIRSMKPSSNRFQLPTPCQIKIHLYIDTVIFFSDHGILWSECHKYLEWLSSWNRFFEKGARYPEAFKPHFKISRCSSLQ